MGLKKTSCNISAKSELGRFSLASFIKRQVLLYFCRLNQNDINPLLKEAYELSKNIHKDGCYTWYSFSNSIFQELGLDIIDYESFGDAFNKIKNNLKSKFNNVISEHYKEKTLNKLSSLSENSKLFLYSQLKTEFKMEDYLVNQPFKIRQQITKLRVSDHTLEIETGRYKNLPRNQRFCKFCHEHKTEDELHFFIHCMKYSNIRSTLFKSISDFKPNFLEIEPAQQLIIILSPENELLPFINDFIKRSLELRR